MWLFNLLFSSLSQLWYVKVRISWSVSVSPLEFELTRVDCKCKSLEMDSKPFFMVLKFSFHAVMYKKQDMLYKN